MPALVKKEKCPQSGLRQSVSDYDASLTAPGAQMAEPVSSSRKSVTLVEENAGALGKLFKLKFDDCTCDPDATGTLSSNMMRYSERYELEHGFRRRPSRLRRTRPRVSAFAANVLGSCTNPAWFSA